MDGILNFFEENILPLITASIAIIAIFQTSLQIKISNKQFLFKKRVEKYTLANSLICLYEDNKSLLDYSDSKDNEPIIVDFQFENLTNIMYLKDITEIIYDVKNNNKKVKFLLKLEELRNLANEIKFLFKGKSGELLSQYIRNYHDLLLELYKYQVLLNLMKDNRISGNDNITYEELQKEFGESKYRNRLYNVISKLKNSYDELSKNEIIPKVEKEIEL